MEFRYPSLWSSYSSFFIIGFVLLETAYANHASDVDVAQSLTYLQDKVDAIDTKLDTVDQKLNSLIAEQQETSSGNETEVVESVEEEDFFPPYRRALELVSVERNPTGNGNRFTVRLRKHREELVYRIYGDGPGQVPNDIIEEADEVWAVSFNVSSETDMVFFFISDTDYDYMMTVILKNQGNEPASQNIVDLPELHVSPEREAVYAPGENISIAALVPTATNSETGEVYLRITKSFSGVDLNTEEFRTDYYLGPMHDVTNEQATPERLETEFTLPTSTHPVSGYLQLSVEVKQTGGTLVEEIQVTREMLVKPSNQTGDFPPEFLTIISQPYYPKSKNGRELRTCRVPKDCWLDCFAVGESVTAINVMKVLPDGGMGYVPDAVPSPHNLDTVQGVYWKFPASADSGDSDGLTSYMCSAYDANSHRVVAKVLDVLAEIDPSIDSEESSVQIEADPTDPSRRRVTLTCVVYGRPLPNVTFSGSQSTVFAMYGESPNSVAPYGPFGAKATKVLDDVSASDLEASRTAIEDGEADGPHCEFFSLQTGSYYQHVFELPEGDLSFGQLVQHGKFQSTVIELSGCPGGNDQYSKCCHCNQIEPAGPFSGQGQGDGLCL